MSCLHHDIFNEHHGYPNSAYQFPNGNLSHIFKKQQDRFPVNIFSERSPRQAAPSSPMRGFAVGLEYIYGERTNKDGSKGTDPRVQFGIQFGYS